MTEAELNALLDVRSENEHIEFKEAKSNFRFEVCLISSGEIKL